MQAGRVARAVALGVTLTLCSVAASSRPSGARVTTEAAAPAAVATISIGAASVVEANSLTSTMTFTVNATATASSVMRVNYATANGSAVAPGDYAAKSGTATIPAGSRNATITVNVVGDKLYEANETFTVTLSNPVNAALGTKTGTGTIVNDDARPIVSVASGSLTEGATGTKAIAFTVSSSAASGLPITVNCATANNTAKAPGDYTAKSGSVTIPVGSTSTTFTVLVAGDLLYEKNEAFSVALSGPVNATLGTAISTGTIVDDDPVPVVSISSTSRSEGNSGATPMPFTVSLSAASGLPVTAKYATANGSAHAPGDYSATTGTVTIAAGATSAVVNVPIVGDVLYEANEAFTLTLSLPVNATLGVAVATGTVLENDAPPVVSIGGASRVEGDSGTTSMLFTVSLSTPSGRAAAVHFQTTDLTAATPGDYTAVSGNVGFAAGATSAVVSVPVVGDARFEADETFRVTLSSPLNSTIGNATATGTITNDDPAPSVSIADVSLTEGDSGTSTAVFHVAVSAPSDAPVTLAYATNDGSATQPRDYIAASGLVTIPAGVTEATVTVAVVGNALHERNKTFTVTLSDPPSGVGISRAVATATIVDDDAPPVVSVADASLSEGDSGTTPEQFQVTLDRASGTATTVEYTTTAGSAAAPGDYVATTGTLTIPAGSTSGTITVDVVGDGVHENAETFTVTLSNPTDATIGRAAGTGTVIDDDVAPSVSLAVDVSVPGGPSGTTTPAVFHVALSFASGAPVTVHYATADATAKQAENYTATAGTLTIAAGDTTGTITVPVIGGMPHEGNRTFTVSLSAPSGATLGAPATATGTIVDEHRLGVATGAILWNKTAAEREAELADLENLGAQWVRTTLFWRDVQPIGPNAFDWAEADSIVASANQHHIAVIYQVIGAPLWSVPGSQPGDKYDYPPNPSLYAGFVATVAARYSPQGVTAYELGNSPNLVNAGNTPDPAFYASLLCATYAAVKAVTPSATILTAGLGGTRDKNGNYSAVHFVQLLYASGAGGCFDAISFHPYTWPQFPPDDGTDGWSAMLAVRQLMATNGDGQKKIWVTEFGAPTGGTGSVSEATQAQMLDVAYRLFVTYSWAGPMCWFRYDDKSGDPTDPGNFYGLVRADGTRKPAYFTFMADAAEAIP